MVAPDFQLDVGALRSGLAANLRALPDCTVRPYLENSPTIPTLQVAGVELVDYQLDFGDGSRMMWIIEGCAGRSNSDSAYMRFDRWITPDGDESVKQAIEADEHLTKRLTQSGSVTLNQTPMADDLVVREFRGYRRHVYETGIEVLLGDWLVEILTP